MMNKYGENQINFGYDSVIWNRVIKYPFGHIKNFIILAAKQYIYRQKKCLSRPLNVKDFENEQRALKTYEKYYAIVNNKLDKHQKKWNVSERNSDEYRDDINEFIMQYNMRI